MGVVTSLQIRPTFKTFTCKLFISWVKIRYDSGSRYKPGSESRLCIQIQAGVWIHVESMNESESGPSPDLSAA